MNQQYCVAYCFLDKRGKRRFANMLVETELPVTWSFINTFVSHNAEVEEGCQEMIIINIMALSYLAKDADVSDHGLSDSSPAGRGMH